MKRAGHESKGRKNEDPCLTVETEKKRLVRYKHLSRVSDGSSNTERLQLSDARQEHNDKVRDL